MVASYDAIVVGARVAGASLALLLGERGLRVLLVDRDRFPSDTLSTHFMHPFQVPLLAKLGVLADVEAAGFRRVTRTRTYVEDCLFEGPIAPNGGYSLAPRRNVLDTVLADHAVRRGKVEFRERTTVDGLLREGDRVVGVVARAAGGERFEATAPVVVGADGKYSKVAEWVAAEAYEAVPAMRPAYYGYFHGVEPLPETALEIFYQGGTIGFIFPMQPGVDCLALELPAGDFEAFRDDPERVFLERFRAWHGMAARLTRAELEGKLNGTRGVDNYVRKPYGPGWALTGDAGCCMDPSTGFGVGDALAQAFWLADALAAARDGADWETSLAGFQRQRDEALVPLYKSTLAYTKFPDPPPATMGWLRATVGSPAFVRYLVPGLPTALANPDVFPANAYHRLARAAEAFAGGPSEPERRA